MKYPAAAFRTSTCLKKSAAINQRNWHLLHGSTGMNRTSKTCLYQSAWRLSLRDLAQAARDAQAPVLVGVQPGKLRWRR
jgi:hypothetical protein